MLPRRGLRWSRQTAATGRGRLEPLSVRHCSSIAQNPPFRSNPLFLKNGASSSRIYTRTSLPKTTPLICNATGVRFASTAPVTAAASTPATTIPPPAASTTGATPTEVLPSSLDNITDFTTESLHGIPVHIGYLKSLGLDYGWGPTSCMEWMLEHIHVYAGTPWWVSISIVAIAVRVILFKAFVNAADNAARMQAVKHITDPLTKKMMAVRGDQVQVMQFRSEIQTINRRAGIKIWRSMVPMVQIFAGYGTFVLLRAMANLPVPGFESGGALWFHNLTIADPYYILPVTTALTLHWVLRKGGETASTTVSPAAMKIMQIVFPGITLAVTSFMPAAVQVSFLVSGILSLIQSSLFRIPAFRSYLKMYQLPAHPAGSIQKTSPYKGTMNVRAPLSQAELSQTYQAGRASTTATTTGPESGVKKFVTGTVQGAAKDIRTTFADATKSAKELVGKGKETMSERLSKSDRAAAAAYEEKRQKEIQQEKYDREQERRARQAAKARKRSL